MIRTIISILIFSIIFIVASFSLSAQVIDPTSTFKTIHNTSYFRILYDNDYFTKTDYYYTQGVAFEYVNPALKKFPVSKILIQPKNTSIQYGIVANTFGYTPTSYSTNNILYGDRPFAASITLKFFAAASDSIKKQRISSSFNAGIIGPSAQGYQIQYGIHKWLHDELPEGWQNQIHNDVVINYQVVYEKNLFNLNNAFIANTSTEINVGTLSDKFSDGINLMAGHFNDPFTTGSKGKKKMEYYFYGQSRINVIGYDATLQGGVFNHSSPYTISASDITRFTFEADAGIVVNFRNFYLCYSQAYLTREFNTGLYHRWGGVSIGFTL